MCVILRVLGDPGLRPSTRTRLHLSSADLRDFTTAVSVAKNLTHLGTLGGVSLLVQVFLAMRIFDLSISSKTRQEDWARHDVAPRHQWAARQEAML